MVVVTGPPSFRNVNSANVRVKFADDSPLSLRAKDSMIGYWFLKSEGAYYYFLVGTPRDYDNYCRSPQSEEKPATGKGRRGRKGTSPDNSGP